MSAHRLLTPVLMVALATVGTRAPDDPPPDELRRALELLSEIPGDEALDALGQLHGRAAQAGRSDVARETMVVIATRIDASNAQQRDRSLRANDFARMALQRGDLISAAVLGRLSLELAEAGTDPDAGIIAGRANDLATMLHQGGAWAEARSMYERALAIRESAEPRDPMKLAATLTNLGILLTDTGDLARARERLQAALELREDLTGASALTAASLANLARARRAGGDAKGALRLLERSWTMFVDVHGADHLDTARAATSLAAALEEVGRIPEARHHREQALAVIQDELGGRHPRVGLALFHLGQFHEGVGQDTVARTYHQRALEIQSTALAPGTPALLDTQAALAGVLSRLGETTASLELLDGVVSARVLQAGPDHPVLAKDLGRRARALGQAGRHAEAVDDLRRALSIVEAAHAGDHPDIALALNNLAVTLAESGDPEAAVALLRRSVDMSRATVGADHPLTLERVGNLAQRFIELGQSEQAWDLTWSTIEPLDRHLELTLAAFSEPEALDFIGAYRSHLDLLIGLSSELDREDEVHRAILLWKGRLARYQLAGRRALHDQQDEDLTPSLDRLREVQAGLSVMATRMSASPEQLEALTRERDELERRLGATGLPTPRNRLPTPTLPEGTALADLLIWRPYDTDRAAAGPGHWASPRVSAWIRRGGRDGVRRIDLGDLSVLEADVRDFLAEILSVDRATGRTGPANNRLRASLWEPLASHLDGVGRLQISPDGIVGMVPWGAILLEDERYLLESHDVVLVDPATKEPLPSSGSSSLVSVGDVRFDGTGEATPRTPGGGGGKRWAPLPATAYESRVVLDLHAEKFGEQAPRVLLTGAGATKARVRDEMSRAKVLHLATHAFFEPPIETDVSAADANAADLLRHRFPGLAAGLVCAGANADPDAHLTAAEVAWLDLSATELVVLSACGTGLGEPRAGEGLIGLRRAFHLAGARTLIASLWAVDDGSTAALMERFYRALWIDGLGRAEALRRAQLEMLELQRRRHGEGRPATWAAFVLSGAWS